MSEPDLKLILAGDLEAWNEACPRLFPTARAVARNKLINPPAADYPADVEDVAIESIYILIKRVLKKDPPLDPPPVEVDDLKPLLSRITDNHGSDFLRKKRALKRPTEEPFTIDKETGQTIEPAKKDDLGQPVQLGQQLEEDDMVRLIGELAKQLKPIEMAVYKDLHKLGLKHREISEKRGIAEGSVGNLIKKVHEELRKKLRKLGIDFFYKNS